MSPADRPTPYTLTPKALTSQDTPPHPPLPHTHTPKAHAPQDKDRTP